MAVVNDEAITQHDLNEQRLAVLVQMREGKVAPPAPDVLERQLLERMITERSLMQFAKETGVRIDDTTVERAFLRLAQDNKISPDELRKVLEREGITYAKYREDIRRELILQRLREREVEARVNVTDAEVDSFLASVDVREGRCRVSAVARPRRGARAGVARSSSSGGFARKARCSRCGPAKDFAQVAASTSDAPDALQGASLGWRNAARLPTAFADLVRKMKQGRRDARCCAARPVSTS